MYVFPFITVWNLFFKEIIICGQHGQTDTQENYKLDRIDLFINVLWQYIYYELLKNHLNATDTRLCFVSSNVFEYKMAMSTYLYFIVWHFVLYCHPNCCLVIWSLSSTFFGVHSSIILGDLLFPPWPLYNVMSPNLSRENTLHQQMHCPVRQAY